MKALPGLSLKVHWERVSEILGEKRNSSPPSLWPAAVSECFALTLARSASEGGSGKNRRVVRTNRFAGGAGGKGKLLILFLEDGVVLISAELKLG